MTKATIIIAIFLALGLATAFYLGMENPPVSLTLASPNKTYLVQLNEHADPYYLPIHLSSRRFASEVRFNLLKGEQTLAQNEILWDDSSDSRLDVYQYHWVSDSVLKYDWDKSVPQSKMDEIIVFNETNQHIDYLIVEASEDFLIVDLQPGASVKLLAFPQSWLSWASCHGSFASGKIIGWNGVNFSIHDNHENHLPHHYCLTVRDDGVSIQSQEIEGFKTVNGVKTTVPKCSINSSAKF